MRRSVRAIVVGAGVGGVFTALELVRRGVQTELIEAWSPGHAGSASGGEHRVLRSSHGADTFYASMAAQARLEWLELAERAKREIFVQSGAVLLARQGSTSWEDASAESLKEIGVPAFRMSPEELTTRVPAMSAEGLAFALWEPEAGFIYAKDGVRAAAEEFLRLGGTVTTGKVETDRDEFPTLDGTRLDADLVYMTCGAWMSGLFPRSVAPHVDVVRQNVIMFAPPAGSTLYDSGRHPAWIDHGYGAYGIPAAGGYGFKPVMVWKQLAIDLASEDRLVDQSTIARTRQYLAMRFPGMVGQPITQTAVAQIANTPDTHFIIDHHPQHENVVLVAGDSGHLLKHGPVIGRYIAEVGFDGRKVDRRFRLGARSTPDVALRPQ